MQVYAGSSPTRADHRKELISASSCSLNDVKKKECPSLLIKSHVRRLPWRNA